MKNEEIKTLTNEELSEKIKVEKTTLHKLKFAHAISPIENPLKLRFSRKLIARLMTEQSFRSLNNTDKK